LNNDPSLINRKILIDLSNQTSEKSHPNQLSNAEQLQQAIPNAFVVKAFNTVSSFVMQSETAGEPHNILVASDHSAAKDKIITLAREMNFESFNAGSIRAARRLENDTKSLFPN
jgi:predicted dinucleotide-binding enzyme